MKVQVEAVAKKNKKSNNTISENRKARFDYEISKKFEAGLSLLGWETKSIRENNAQIAEAYTLLKDSEAYLIGSYIDPLKNSNQEMDPTRSRKLLLNRKELNEIIKSTSQKGNTCIPTKLYWKNGLIKCEIALAIGKKSQDKRNTIKSRDWERQKAKELRERNKNQLSFRRKGIILQLFWGRTGFDSRYKTSSACREGNNSRKKIIANLLVGENADYALAA